jgi:hypothetical protein
MTLFVGFVVGMFAVGAALAQDEKKTATGSESATYSPEEMDAWQKSATPGPHHARFKDMVGAWNAQCKMWMQPGTEPQVAQLKAEYKLLFDGRYVVGTIDGEMMGMPFHGMGISGYDNVKGVHTTMWCDNMSTAMMFSEGQCSDDCKVETYHSVYMDPMTGKDMQIKLVTRYVDKDKHVFEYFMVNPDGSEFKSMEITYTRM